MEVEYRFMFVLFFILIITSMCYSVSSSKFPTLISGHVFDGGNDIPKSTSRNLLQEKKICPANFEFLNYTIVTSQCKGPKYLPNLCCKALKELACPYTTELNDLTNDCASRMFGLINIYGKYPPGLFSSLCREGKLGLECPLTPLDSTSLSNNAAPASSSSLSLMLVTPLLLLI